MDPSNPVTQQYLISLAVVAVGLAGCLAPLKWNPLQLKRSIAKRVSDETNLKIARGIGAVLVLGGIVMAIGTFQVGAFK